MNKILIALLVVATPAAAQSLGEKTGVNQLIDRPPTATDMLLELHQFDLFQSQLADIADKRGDDGIRAVAKADAAEADKRGDALLDVQDRAKLKFAFPEELSRARDNTLGGLSGSVAEVFVREYYEAQRAEHESVLSMLRRYLAKPDNDVVKAFAERQVPQLESGLKKIESAQAQGPPKPLAKELSKAKSK